MNNDINYEKMLVQEQLLFEEELIIDMKVSFENNGIINTDLNLLNNLLFKHDLSIVQCALIELYKNKISNAPKEFSDEEIISNLKEFSKIQLPDDCYYLISQNFTSRYICNYILINSEITNEDFNFIFETKTEIYENLGIIYSTIMANYSINLNSTGDTIQSLGGKNRAKLYKEKKSEILKKWETSSFHSYAEFARKHAEFYELSTKTIENWLSQEFSKPKS